MVALANGRTLVMFSVVMNSIWVASIILWAMILGLSLVMLSLMRRVGELTNLLDASRRPESADGVTSSNESGPLINIERLDARQEPEEVETFAPFSKVAEHKLPLLAGGGVFPCGGEQTVPQLIVFFSPKSRACEQLPEAMKDFVKNNPPTEIALLAVLDMPRARVERYMSGKSLESVPLAILEEVPEALRPVVTPFAIAIAMDGKIAARGKPKNIVHLTEMAVAARHMADMCPAHSRRAHEWGESAPYWSPGQLVGRQSRSDNAPISTTL